MILEQRIATHAHEGQVDKQGQPYLGHLLRVAARVPYRLRPAALLHDILEDTTVTQPMLLGLGVALATVETVQVLTRGDETYADYIQRVALHPDAVTIKLADLADNLDPDRGPIPTSLVRRYQRAVEVLSAL